MYGLYKLCEIHKFQYVADKKKIFSYFMLILKLKIVGCAVVMIQKLLYNIVVLMPVLLIYLI